ncbi:TRAP transporter substrate-binding protein [Spartinivicinus ruber]|uniref:TRAP transporter substrate-binding protein n=1 Tax=Spartinivicinus ruber TaxID=2683272 RepID=UPI0013D1B861|nr:TRAP transporter substrate-binding protein [Spartinivicinus ruber]
MSFIGLAKLLGCQLLSYLWFIQVALSEPTTIICSTDNPKVSLHVLALEKFGELVSRYSNGELITKIHYRGNQKYPAISGEETNMNMVMSGLNHPKVKQPLHITVIASGNASLKAYILEFLMLPYIFPEIESAEKLFKSKLMTEKVNDILAKKHNVRAIGWLIGGYRHMTNSKRPVTQLDEMKGLIIRTPRNRLMRDTYLAFGATVKALNWGDTFNALKEKHVDGQENPYNVIYYSKFWEADQKYVTNNAPFLWTGPILINEIFYQSLPNKLKIAVNRAALEAAEYEWKWIIKKNIFSKKNL